MSNPLRTVRVTFPTRDAFERHCFEHMTRDGLFVPTTAALPASEFELVVTSREGSVLFEALVRSSAPTVAGGRNGVVASFVRMSESTRMLVEHYAPRAPAPEPPRPAVPSLAPPASSPGMNAAEAPSAAPSSNGAWGPSPWAAVAPSAAPFAVPWTPTVLEAPVRAPATQEPRDPQRTRRVGVAFWGGTGGVAALALGVFFFLANVEVPASTRAAEPASRTSAAVRTPEAPALTPVTPAETRVAALVAAPVAREKKDPKAEARTLTNKGLARLDAGDAPAAIAAFRKALVLDGRNAKAHIGLATAQMIAGDNAAAKASLRKFLQIAPNDPLSGQARQLLESL